MDFFSILRVVVSLAVVFGAIWWIQRRVAKKNGGRAAKRVPVTVLGRASLGGKASAVVIETGGTRLVLGVTEHGVTVLTSQDAPAEEPVTVPAVAAVPDAVLAPVAFDERAKADAEKLAASWSTSAPVAPAPAPAVVRPVAKKAARTDGLAKPVFFRDAAGNPVTRDGLREGARRFREVVGL